MQSPATTGLAPNGTRLSFKLFPGLVSGLREILIFFFAFLNGSWLFSAGAFLDFGLGDGFEEFKFKPVVFGSGTCAQVGLKVMDVVFRRSETLVAWESAVSRGGLDHAHTNQIVRQQVHPQRLADRELTGLQLYWDAVEASLSNRPLTILDPKVSGRQHLLLADPLMLGGQGLLQQTFPNRDDEEETIFPTPRSLEE